MHVDSKLIQSGNSNKTGKY